MTKIIKHALIEKNMTITQLAKEIGRSRVYTSNVINGIFTKPSDEILKRIAVAIGMDCEDIWPKATPKTFTELDYVLAASERMGLSMEPERAA